MYVDEHCNWGVSWVGGGEGGGLAKLEEVNTMENDGTDLK